MIAPEPSSRRPLGASGLTVSRIGLGTWAFSGTGWNQGWGPTDDDVSVATIVHAVRSGLTWIDTAATYGIGHSEEIVGRALRILGASERPLVFTKCGVLRDARDPLAPAVRSLRPDSIRAELEQSLRRLGLDHVDLLHFHFPDETGIPVEDSWGTLATLIEEGKVRAAGLSNFPIDLMERCHAVRPIDSIQPGLSLIHRESLADVIPWAAARGVSCLVYSPLRSGLLTDSLTLEEVRSFPQDDWRREHPDFQPPAVERSLALRDSLRAIAARWSTTVAGVAIAWALACPGVTGVIAGARAPHEVEAWKSADVVSLEEDDLAEIRRNIVTTGAGAGPIGGQ